MTKNLMAIEQKTSQENKKRLMDDFQISKENLTQNLVDDDFELSQEVIDRVMSKVQNINDYGIAFSRVVVSNHENKFEKDLPIILRYGIKGSICKARDIPTKDRLSSHIPSEYKTQLQNNNPVVHFHVNGQSNPNIQHRYSSGGSITILFDVSSMTLGEPPLESSLTDYTHSINTPGKYNEYYVNSDIALECWRKAKEELSQAKDSNEKSEILKRLSKYNDGSSMFAKINIKDLQKIDTDQKKRIIDYKNLVLGLYKEGDDTYIVYFDYVNSGHSEEYGFVLSPRVPPRRFTGVKYNSYYPKDRAICEGVYYDHISEDQANKLNEEDLKIIIRAMLQTYKDTPELLLPIYDRYGNLHWPQKMSYSEVKSYVNEKRSLHEKESS